MKQEKKKIFNKNEINLLLSFSFENVGAKISSLFKS